MDIDKEEIGITVAYDDVEGWINAIHRIADHPEEAQKMGANARKLAALCLHPGFLSRWR